MTKTCRVCNIIKTNSEFYRFGDGRFFSTCKECYKARVRAYKKKNRDRVRRSDQKYYLSNFFKRRACMFNARNGSSITGEQLKELWDKQDGKCAFTGWNLDSWNAAIDHIVPRSRGGRDDISNLRWLHKDTNRIKWNLSDDDFIDLCINMADSMRKHLELRDGERTQLRL